MIIFENKELFVVATGHDRPSANRKTGPMIQLWILSQDMDPVESVKTGHDAQTVCAGCPFASGNGCYVNVGQSPLSIWRAYKRGSYGKLLPQDYSQFFKGKTVRFGAYGNPSLIPLAIVKAVASASNGWTGYFHNWKEMQPAMARAYGQYFMVSTETEESRCKADSAGLRYFHVSPLKPKNAIECLSDAKGITCEKCKLCAGLSKSRLPSVWINPHGSKKSKAELAALN